MQSISINNTQRGRKIGFVFSLAIVVSGMVIVASLVSEVPYSLLVQIISLGVGVVLLALFKYGGFNFVMIEFDGKVLEIKFYPVFPFGRWFRMIKVDISDLEKIQVTNGWMGLGKGLVLFQKKKEGVAKYPVVWLSALCKEDIFSLKKIAMF